MNIREIIKNAFIFPSKNLETLSIYAILTLLSGAFIFEGVVKTILGIFDIGNIIIGVICIIISFLIGLITRRISIQCIKSGIDLEDKMPDFNWRASFGTGLKKVVITIYYFIVPALIVVAIALIVNVFGNIQNLGQTIITQIPSIIIGNPSIVENAINSSLWILIVSIAITIAAGLIIFLIFSFFQAMGEARLAHTGNLKDALNIFGAIKDIRMIGVGKLITLTVLIFVIVTCIESVLTVVFDHFIVLSVLNIIIVPYIALFTQRALGLLYADIV